MGKRKLHRSSADGSRDEHRVRRGSSASRCSVPARMGSTDGCWSARLCVLAAIAVPLADAGVSIFAVSTFDTDYILLPIDCLAIAVRTLSDAGHRVVTPD
jgi:hypothetical protein